MGVAEGEMETVGLGLEVDEGVEDGFVVGVALGFGVGVIVGEGERVGVGVGDGFELF